LHFPDKQFQKLFLPLRRIFNNNSYGSRNIQKLDNIKMDTQKKKYDKDFYERNKTNAKLKSVEIVLTEVFKIIPPCRSAVDFGCATGTWLNGLGKYNITDIRGYDGKWVDQSKLLIPKECFFEADFDKPIKIDRRFDLAISIEVAEHLQESSAESFVENITKSADFVLFSAAIPYQGGDNHVNEQWPEYWNKLFNRFGFVCIDSIRKKLWSNYDVLDFHRQNILLFVNMARMDEIHVPPTDICTEHPPMSLIAPHSYLRLIRYKKLFSPFTPLKTLFKIALGNKYYDKIKNKL
jgi:hypothetical protein